MGEVVPFKPEEAVSEPRLEDGYCKVVNALAEGLASHPLTSIQQRVVWAVIRMTYGWGKAKDVIACSQLAEVSGLTRQQCNIALSQLLSYGVIIRQGGSRSPIKVNTRTADWSFPEKGTQGRFTPSVNSNNKNCSVNSNSVHSTNSNSMHTKDKESYKNTSCSSTSQNPPSKSSPKKPDPKIREGAAIQNKSGTQWGYPEDLELAEMIAQVIDNRLEQDAPNNRNMASWANTIRLMREQNNRTPEMIRALFAFAMNDEFWSGNIESPGALRKHWTKLAMKRKAQRDGGGKHAKGGNDSSGGSGLDKQFTDFQHARDTFED